MSWKILKLQKVIVTSKPAEHGNYIYKTVVGAKEKLKHLSIG
jgi:hypothetical protein